MAIRYELSSALAMERDIPGNPGKGADIRAKAEELLRDADAGRLELEPGAREVLERIVVAREVTRWPWA